MNTINNKYATVLDSQGLFYDISVCIIAYNVEKYINAAIESVMMQQTDLRYEIVIGENASTDATGTILKKIWNNNKDKVCVILNNYNLGLSTNMFNTLCKAKGKYITILYGDDYWIDANKLQEQFDFLETHSEYVAATMPLEFRYDGESDIIKTVPGHFLWNKKIDLKMYLKGYDFPMGGIMFRGDVFYSNTDHFEIMVKASKSIDDASFCILLAMQGDIYVIGKPTGVYRCFKENSGATNFNSVNSIIERSKKNIILCNNLDELLNGMVDLSIRYGFILSSAFWAYLKKKITYKEYQNLIPLIAIKYRKHKKIILIKKKEKKTECNIRSRLYCGRKL